MWSIILLLTFIGGGTCQFVKYYDETGHLQYLWIVTHYPNRPCKDDEGWHRCVHRSYGIEVCGSRSMTNSICVDSPRLKCTVHEMEYDDGHGYQCYPRYRVRELQGYESVYLPCRENEFECRVSKRCLPLHFVRDGHVDCNIMEYGVQDKSDETDFVTDCPVESGYRCSDSTSRCVPREWFMNRIRDCPHGEDENTVLLCNNQTEFECAGSKRCLLRRYVNDNFTDCPRNDDEMISNFTCVDHLEFSCGGYNGIRRCLPREWVGDNAGQCSNESVVPLTRCAEGEVKCLDNKRCLPSKYKCDGVQHCSDGSDEVEMCPFPPMYRYLPGKLIPWSFLLFESFDIISQHYPEFKPKRDLTFGFKCYTSNVIGRRKRVSPLLRTVPQWYITEGISVCTAGEDNCFNGQAFTCARCLDGTIISKSQVCDGVIDCFDLSDECPCERSTVGELCKDVFSFFRNETEVNTTSIDLVCDGKADMENAIDEEYCNTIVLDFTNVHRRRNPVAPGTSVNCAARHFGGSNPPTQGVHCDGKLDCAFMEDECASDCLMTNTALVKKCFQFLSSPVSDSTSHGFHRYYYNTTLTNEAIPTITYGHDSAGDHNMNCEYVITVMEDPHSLIVAPSRRGNPLCTDDIFRYQDFTFLCDIKGVRCPWMHYCGSDEPLLVDISSRCDYTFDCIDKSDEWYCSSKTHFYCANGHQIIPSFHVGNGRADCYDRSDELETGTEMLQSIALRIFVWFCGPAIIIFNGIVLRNHCRKLGSLFSKSTLSYCNVYLLIWLAISDSIIGFVLLALAIKSLQFSGIYYLFDLDWRLSLACNIVGIFTVISAQTSVNLLIMMVGLRLYVTYYPHMANRINFKLLLVVSFVALGGSIILASYPTWGGSNFSDFLYIEPNLFLDSSLVEASRVESYMRKTETIAAVTNVSSNIAKGDFESSFAQAVGSWVFNSEEGREYFPNRQVDIRGILGFYSSSPLCSPAYFSKTSSYSLLTGLYNLTFLLLVCIGYFLIFYRERNSASVELLAIGGNEDIKEMMTRILSMTVTGILSRLPLIIISLLSYCVHQLPEFAHRLPPIVFFSISSFLNPVIYLSVNKATIRFWNNLTNRVFSARETETIQGDIHLQTMSRQEGEAS